MKVLIVCLFIFLESQINTVISNENLKSATSNINQSEYSSKKSKKQKKRKEYSIDQVLIIDKIEQYLIVMNRNLNVLDKAGQCNGLAFLVQYYAELDKVDEFFLALESISAWDGKKESLQQSSKISACKNLGDLFEHWINDIIWFQQAYLRIQTAPNLCLNSQHRRIEQFEWIKQYDDDKEIVILNNSTTYLGITLPQLAGILEIWSCFPGSILEFKAGGHATSLRVLEGGAFFYYDANQPKRLATFTSPLKLAKKIIECHNVPKNSMIFDIMAYQFVPKGQLPTLPNTLSTAKVWKIEKNSSLGLTPLHVSIYTHDIEALQAQLRQSKFDPNQTDNLGITPLFLATQLRQWKAMQSLLETGKIDLNLSSFPCQSPLHQAIYNYDLDATELLIHYGANLFVTAKNRNEFNEDNMVASFDIPAFTIGLMNSPSELEFVKQLCIRVPELLKLRDAKGRNLTYYATICGNKDLLKIFDEFPQN